MKLGILEKVSKTEEKASLLLNNAKRKAVIEAEHVRKVAVFAVWWLVVTTVLSGGAAVLGGIISI